MVQIGRRLPANTDVPPCPQALLGSWAHKLDKKSNFPVGLLGPEYSQTHCFFSGAVDFYSSWCKWADKETVGSRLWPSCLLSHSGLSSTLFLSHSLWGFLPMHMTSLFEVFCSPHGWRYCCCEREFITSAEVCCSQGCQGSQKALHAMLSQQIAGKLEWAFICYWTLLLSSSLLSEGTFLLLFSFFRSTFTIFALHYSHTNSCVSPPQSIVLPLSTLNWRICQAVHLSDRLQCPSVFHVDKPLVFLLHQHGPE